MIRNHSAKIPSIGRSGRSRTPERQADLVYAQIKDNLYLADWALPGKKLTEHGLSALVGTSRAPVREALQKLVQERYLIAHFRNGYTVREFSKETFRELTDVRIMLECQALRWSHTHPALTKKLHALQTTWTPSEDTLPVGQMIRMNREFHMDLVTLAANAQLSRIHADVLERVEVVQRLDFTEHDRVEATYREHRRVIDTMIDGRIDTAIDLLTEHIQRSTDSVNERMAAYFS